jgi:hypothetical protein
LFHQTGKHPGKLLKLSVRRGYNKWQQKPELFISAQKNGIYVLPPEGLL